ncbi:MAG: glycosyltransferase [Brevundimonas sp.]|uniref:glycosyltransferase n=1 Tax=Brevundimonas sp. TaxID=1871086 RepID=UPI0027335209|nr:glycosyltransferase [Brevundimonas sp.]MDP3405213.1 glycosyltransferase [Brevundimonas sp.]
MSKVARSSGSRALVVCQEPPWPTSHGARVDIWNRYDGLVREGWSVGLICWRDGAQTQADADAGFNGVFEQVWVLDKPKTPAARLARLARLSYLPSLAAALYPPQDKMVALVAQVRAFAPDLLVADSVHMADFTRRLARTLDIPVVVRSHNVEHDYMAIQYRLAGSWRSRLSIAAARLHLKTFEIQALKTADHVLEISKDALPFWKNLGVERIDWVPTFVPSLERVQLEPLPWAERRYDAVYLGNLWSPNNVAAVRWIVDEVMPHVRKVTPEYVMLIAGSNPSPEFQTYLAEAENVEWIANPEDAAAIRAQGRVLVNPILEGSGLNTKSVEMLFFDSPLVMTPFAADGMDADSQACFHLTAEPERFAALMTDLAKAQFVVDQARTEARARFGQGGAGRLSTILRDVVADKQHMFQ